jgi:hypothetical protein
MRVFLLSLTDGEKSLARKKAPNYGAFLGFIFFVFSPFS